MIFIITYKDKNTIMVSHGYNIDDDSIVILPNLPIYCFNYKFDNEVGEYVLI